MSSSASKNFPINGSMKTSCTRWLREASLQRLSMLVKNKTEELQLRRSYGGLGISTVSSITSTSHNSNGALVSGLSDKEIDLLMQWVRGVSSGRSTLLAILDCRESLKLLESDTSTAASVVAGQCNPSEMIRSMLCLPEGFLCDGGTPPPGPDPSSPPSAAPTVGVSEFLYDKIFSRPPMLVVREALALLAQKASGSSEEALGSLNLDQIHIAVKQLKLDSLSLQAGEAGRESLQLRLQIVVELVRLHLKGPAPSPGPPEADTALLQHYLALPMQAILLRAKAAPSEELERFNTAMKPYLRQLAGLKALLAAQLKELQDSRAFLALGLSRDADDDAIKQAYRALAVKLHPDKPGGDTARFQQLQNSYQEVLKRRRADGQQRQAEQQARRDRAGHRDDKGHSPTRKRDEKGHEEAVEKEEKEEEEEGHGAREVEEKLAEAEEGPEKAAPIEEEEEVASAGPEALSDKERRERLRARCPSGRLRAQAVVADMAPLLRRLQEAAGAVTALAQRNIQWQRRLDRAAKLRHPAAMTDIARLIAAGEECSQCSLQQAIDPVEAICDLAQQISSLAMEIPGQCGVEFAAAAAACKPFLRAVEDCMHLSLSALKIVVSLITGHEQLSSCLRQVHASLHMASQNEEIHDLLVEMVRAGVKSNVMTASSTVDRVVECALAASAVQAAAQRLVQSTEDELAAQARRKVAEQSEQEQEQDYSEEDRELLRKSRQDRDRQASQEEDGDRHRVPVEEADGEPGERGLTDLRDKIRLLQVQLKMQHAQALHTMNSEIVSLQQELLREIAGLPLVASLDSVFSGPQGGPRGFRGSLLSLVADFLDSSLLALGSELREVESSPADSSKERWLERERALLLKHLQWLDIVWAGQDEGDVLGAVLDALLAPSPPSRARVKLALLPDPRGKTLFLASLVDPQALRALLAGELRLRLQELLGQHRSGCPALFPDPMTLPSPDTLPSMAPTVPDPPALPIDKNEEEEKEEERRPVQEKAFQDIDEDP